MINIESGKELNLDNVLSLRKKMKQQDVSQALLDIGQFLDNNGVQKKGSIVTATFGLEQNESDTIVDIEILVPMNKYFELSSPYTFKKKFQLVNAVYARHKGNPDLLENTYSEIIAFISANHLQQITVGYNVTVNDLQPMQSLDEFIVDVYIGMNPSTL